MAMPPPAMATARATARVTAMALAMDMVWPVSCLFLRCSGARHGLGVVLGATMFFSRGKRLCDYLSVRVGREPDDRGVVLLIGARRQKKSRVPAEFQRNSPPRSGGEFPRSRLVPGIFPAPISPKIPLVMVALENCFVGKDSGKTKSGSQFRGLLWPIFAPNLQAWSSELLLG